MWRLDTALNWKNWVLYWHKKITYEVPCADCPNPHDCPTWWEWDPIEEKCFKPTCEPGDPGYGCGCQCKDNEECIDWECREKVPPTSCWTCYTWSYTTNKCEYDESKCPIVYDCPTWYTWDPVRGKCICDDCPQPPTPCPEWCHEEWWTCVCPPVCWDCETLDQTTWECIPDPDKCPPEPECPEWSEWDDEIWECVRQKIKLLPCIPWDQDCPIVSDECFDWTNVWDGARINADGKFTWKVWSSKLNWQRYWFNTLCYNRIEFFARITTEWEWANKSGIEHWYAETKWDLSYIATGYYWDFVQLHHDDVLKIIIYSDWREETFIKSFIRPGVWTWWEVYSNIKRPETPPSWKINWMMCWVFWWAEIWDIRAYPTDEIIIPEDDAIIETPPQNVGGCINYELQGCKDNQCWYCKAFWTVRDANDNVWQTMYFWWSNPFRWANWETKRWYITYRDWVLTIPKWSSFKYVWQDMNGYNTATGWRTDFKFRVNCQAEYPYWNVYVRFWVCDANGEYDYQRYRWTWYASDLVNRDLWFTYETCYTCSYPEYVENAMLYYWTWTWEYRWYEKINDSYNFIDHSQWGMWYYFVEIWIDDNCNIDSIDVSYMSEWQWSYYIRH